MADDDGTSVPWPRKGRTLLGPADEWQLNACVGSYRGDLNAYVSGFDKAGGLLFEAMTSGSHASPDVMVYPLVTLWRHAVELRLKQIVGYATWMKKGKPRYPTGHDLRDLWSDAKPFLVELDEQNNEGQAIRAVQKTVHQLHEVDPICEGFRYPTEKATGAPTLKKAPAYVNLLQLHEVMVETSTFLDCATMEPRQRLDYVMDCWAEEARQAE
jgi:hypothetical protein